MQRREEIARAYVNGNAAPLQDVVTHEDPATFFPPHGEVQRGAAAVERAYVSDAQHFAQGSESRLDVMHSEAGRLAFWSGTQIATVRTPGNDAEESMHLRVTEIFRLEGGDWKLVHRHADVPAAAQPDVRSGVAHGGDERRPSH
jgi:ketosteroid isomerase-like protein